MYKVYKNSNTDELKVFNINDITTVKLTECYDQNGQQYGYVDAGAYIEKEDGEYVTAYDNYDEFMELVEKGCEILGEEIAEVITEYNGSNYKSYFFSSEYDNRGIWKEVKEYKFIKFTTNYSYPSNTALVKKDNKYYLLNGIQNEYELEEISKKQYLEYKNNLVNQ